MKSCSPAFLCATLLFAANALQPQHSESFLYLNGASKPTEKPSESTSAPAKNTSKKYGKDVCPCIGIDNVEGESNIKMQDGTLIKYPADLGSSCEAWEKTSHPKCSSEKDAPSWCTNKWCYVDPCNCDLQILPKMTEANVTYRGERAYWSYNTCGGKDEYSKTLKFACVNLKSEDQCAKHDKCAWNGEQCGGKEVMKTCKEAKKALAIHGEEDCRCVGTAGKNGTAKLNLNTTHKIDYPADVGGYCKAWEGDVFPECNKEGDKPEWCEMKWCWVDPCKCALKVPPKATREDFTFQGMTAHWSYATCGSEDKWSAENKDSYCITQESEADCCKLSAKCAWTGKKCMSKELATKCPGSDAKEVKECGKDAKSGTYRTRCAVTSVLMLGAFAMM